MEFARDSQLVCVCLMLMFGGVLAKSLTSLELESPCPREWLYVGSQRCAYVIPSDIPNRELNIFCQVQFESQFLLLEDKPVCIKSSEDDNLIYAPEDLETSQASRRNRLFKRGPVTLNGAPNMGIDVGSGLTLSGTLSCLPVTYWLLFSKGRDGSGRHHGHYGGVRAFNKSGTVGAERDNIGYEGTDDEKIEVNDQTRVNDICLDLSPEEEELILEKLREVVRKCTNADPNKRPTAAEVQKLLEMADMKKL